MCIIVVKNKDIEMPDRDKLENCFSSNPDGAGYMYWDNKDKYVHIAKGFMTFESFMMSLESHCFTKNDVVVMHFRIATHGGVSQAHCHPFPVSRDLEFMRKTRVKCTKAIAHNGIIKGYDYDKSASDTMLFNRDVLAHPILNKHIGKDTDINNIIGRILDGDKLVIMSANGRLNMWGNWEEKDGVLYSNSGYKWSSLLGKKGGYLWDDWDYDIQPKSYAMPKYESAYSLVNSEMSSEDRTFILKVAKSINSQTNYDNVCRDCDKPWYDCICDNTVDNIIIECKTEEQIDKVMQVLPTNGEVFKKLTHYLNVFPIDQILDLTYQYDTYYGTMTTLENARKEGNK